MYLDNVFSADAILFLLLLKMRFFVVFFAAMQKIPTFNKNLKIFSR